MSKVVSLYGGPVNPAGPGEPPALPNEELISILEGLLERVKTGEISAMAYAYPLPDHCVGTGWAADDHVGKSIALGFAVSALHHEYYDGLRNG